MSPESETQTSTKTDSAQDNAEVILKGENHASREDHDEEIVLMRDGIDVLVLEGSEKDPEWGITEGWFQQAMAGMFYVMGPLYLSKDLLVEFAKFQDTDVFFTRESNAEILRNAPRLIRWFSAFLYFIMLPSSVIAGLVWEPVMGTVLLFASFAVPVLTIRIYNSKFSPGEKNRDRVMAGKIMKAVETNDSVLAIVGDDHADGVREALPEELDVEYHPSKSERLTVSRFWDFTVRGFQMFSLLFFLYLVILWAVVNFVLPLI